MSLPNDTALTPFTPSVTRKDASAKTVADFESLAKRLNQLIREHSGNTTIIQQIVNSPSSNTSVVYAGNGLSFESDGQTLDVNVDGTNIVISSDTLNLGVTGISAGTYGDATHVPQITFDVYGRASAATLVSITGTVPDGTIAGQILVWSGTAWVQKTMSGDATMASTGALTLASVITAGGPTGSATVVPVITYDAKGRLTAVTTATITGTVPAGTDKQILVNQSGSWAAVSASGDVTVTANTGTLTLASVISAGGPTGSATVVPVITYDAKGRLTAVTTASISGTVPNGSAAGQILYWNGSAWVANTAGAANQSIYFNSTTPTPTSLLEIDVANTRVMVNRGAATAIASVEFQVHGTGGAEPRLLVAQEETSASNSSSISLVNGTQAKGIDIANVGTAADYWGGTAQGDAIVRQSGGSGKLWFGVAATAGAYLDTSSSRTNVTLASNQATPASGTAFSILRFGSILSSAINVGAEIQAVANETWSNGSALGCNLYFYTCPVGSATTVLRIRITPEGTVHTRAAGSALATSATDGFLGVPNCAGTPTGVPGARSTVTGSSMMVYDTTNNKLWVYNGAWKGVTLT